MSGTGATGMPASGAVGVGEGGTRADDRSSAADSADHIDPHSAVDNAAGIDRPAAVDSTTGIDSGHSGAPSSHRPLGILAALPQELGDLIAAMRAESGVRTVTHGQRDYHLGTVHGTPCVVTLARVGKVAAAATVSALIHVFDVEAVVFTGVAGGVGGEVRVGDIVVANVLMQHDLDAS